MRAFVAITLPEATRLAITAARRAFVQAAPDWAAEKWVAEENLHVTVKFLGSIQPAVVDDVAAALAAVAAVHAPFALTLGDVVARPSGRARMLWVRVADGVAPARLLAEGVDAALAPLLSLEPEERRYSPHVTVARLRRPRHVPREALAAADDALDAASPACGVVPSGVSPVVVSVRGVSVMSSRTLPSGPVYEEVASVPLGLD